LTGTLLIAHSIGGADAYGWVLFYTLVTILLPVVYIVIQVQRGVITDFHMRVRAQRIIPMLLAFICALFAWAVMSLASAPRVLVIFAGIGVVQTGLLWLITLRWKISGHATAISGLAIFLFGLFGWAASPALLAIPAVAWARLRLDRHDLWQTIAGSLAGIAFMLWTLYLIANHCQSAMLICN
jgi:hypothetical protein